jgi:hypothetical protein
MQREQAQAQTLIRDRSRYLSCFSIGLERSAVVNRPPEETARPTMAITRVPALEKSPHFRQEGWSGNDANCEEHT